MKSMKFAPVFSLSLAALLLQYCGAKSKKDDAKDPSPTASEIVADSSLTGSLVNASHGDTVAATADQGTSSASLANKNSDDDQSSFTKSCSESGNNAVVSIASTISRSRTVSNTSGTVTLERVRTGSGSITRTWSRSDGTAVKCNTGGYTAKVDLQNPSGLKLDIAFSRSRLDKQTYTGPRLTRTTTKSFSSSGKRSVSWSSNSTTSDSSTTYIRNKQIEIKDVTQDLSMTDKDGKTYATSLVSNTASDQPLVVSVERNKSDHSVVYKTIVSGQVVTKKDSDTTIKTTYSSFKFSSECKVVSGTATIVVSDAAGATVKTYTLSADSSGDADLKDSGSSSSVEGFQLDDCDSEDKL